MSENTNPPHDETGPFRESAVVRIRGGEGRPSNPIGKRRPSVPVVMVAEYTASDWDAESFALFAEGADPSACPECNRTGFFGPRVVDEVIKCRACRFCGFWQRVGHPPTTMLPTAHDCATWPVVSKAPYIWWVLPDVQSYHCPYCRDEVIVPRSIVVKPSDAQDHPWHKIPQGRSRAFYQRLWENWEVTASRVVL